MTPCRSADRADPLSRPPRSAHTAAGNGVPTCPEARPLPPPSAADADTARTPLQSASRKPPIASSSAASLPPRTSSELGGQLTRYKRRTNDPLRTKAHPCPPNTADRRRGRGCRAGPRGGSSHGVSIGKLAMAKISLTAHDVFLAVDVQNDFCPGGRLAVPGGDEIVPAVNRLCETFRHVV